VDLEKFFPKDWDNIDGFVSLNFFKEHPYTVDYKKGLVIFDFPESLKNRKKEGVLIPIDVKSDNYSTTFFANFDIPNNERLKLEVDTGSDSLILHIKYMRSLTIDPNGEQTRVSKKTDETGFSYTRYFSEINGKIFPSGAVEFSQNDSKVTFREIIYDGLIGHSFLSKFTYTIDLKNSQMILNY